MLLKMVFHLYKDSCITFGQQNTIHIDGEKSKPISHILNKYEMVIMTPCLLFILANIPENPK